MRHRSPDRISSRLETAHPNKESCNVRSIVVSPDCEGATGDRIVCTRRSAIGIQDQSHHSSYQSIAISRKQLQNLKARAGTLDNSGCPMRMSSKFPVPDIPRSILRGRTVDLAAASGFYGFHADMASSYVPNDIHRTGTKYRMSERLFAVFCQQAKWIELDPVVLLTRANLWMEFCVRPPDLVAVALYVAIRELLAPRKKLPRRPEDKAYIAEAWELAGEIGYAIDERMCRFDLNGNPIGGANAIDLDVYCSHDRTKLPYIRITISGAPVAALVRTMSERNAPLPLLAEAPHLRQPAPTAQLAFEAISKNLEIVLGLKHPASNRPKSNKGQKAFYLKETEKLTWPQVAKRVCEEEHSHSKECINNVRTQALNYRKAVEEEMARLQAIATRRP